MQELKVSKMGPNEKRSCLGIDCLTFFCSVLPISENTRPAFWLNNQSYGLPCLATRVPAKGGFESEWRIIVPPHTSEDIGKGRVPVRVGADGFVAITVQGAICNLLMNRATKLLHTHNSQRWQDAVVPTLISRCELSLKRCSLWRKLMRAGNARDAVKEKKNRDFTHV